MKIDAMLWDFDGTLVNSAPKNISITKDILSEVAPRLSGNKLPEQLRSESRYHEANHAAENRRDLYIRFLGLTPEETDLAGSLWSKHQRHNTTPVALFDGIIDAIHMFAHIPHGICSQNSAANILSVLDDVFGAINMSADGDALVMTSLQQQPRRLRLVGGRNCSASDRATASHVFLLGKDGEYLISDGFKTLEKVSTACLAALL
jgi:phosphoglycolate phosphatase-like HAD superfamily hydrolase